MFLIIRQLSLPEKKMMIFIIYNLVIDIGIFLDTGFYVGLCHPKDKFASQCKTIFKKLSKGIYGLLYTSFLIISEASTLLAVRTSNNERVLNLLSKYLWGDRKIATILPYQQSLEKEIWNLFKKVNTIDLKFEKPMSFVDISSVIFCQHHQIENIVSFDSHFDKFLNRIYE
ncbi:MAG: PIN domain-containing protein [Promethearchaeota archaeon]|nr:MAG: PIN domain-containing protein [Candidatus Lokiarchaeota archaeon]